MASPEGLLEAQRLALLDVVNSAAWILVVILLEIEAKQKKYKPNRVILLKLKQHRGNTSHIEEHPSNIEQHPSNILKPQEKKS